MRKEDVEKLYDTISKAIPKKEILEVFTDFGNMIFTGEYNESIVANTQFLCSHIAVGTDDLFTEDMTFKHAKGLCNWDAICNLINRVTTEDNKPVADVLYTMSMYLKGANISATALFIHCTSIQDIVDFCSAFSNSVRTSMTKDSLKHEYSTINSADSLTSRITYYIDEMVDYYNPDKENAIQLFRNIKSYCDKLLEEISNE